MKSKNLEYKLKTYTTLATSVIAVSSNVNAQVIYTDIIPDTTINNGWYLLDLNNDKAVDFMITQDNAMSMSTYFYYNIQYGRIAGGFGGNEVLMKTSPHALAIANNLNDMIDGNKNTWGSSVMPYLGAVGTRNHVPYQTGDFLGVSDMYAGLRIKINSQWHYGWVRLDVSLDATQVIVKDYAYESTPNVGIMAGSTVSVNIKKATLPDDIMVYTYNKTLYVNFKDKYVEGSVIKLFNLTGQEIKTIAANETKMEINVDDIAEGVYLVSIYNNDGIFSRKISIK